MKEDKLLKKAIALAYDEKNNDAPHIQAKGWGKIAEKIIEISKKENIPVVEDKDLVKILDKLEIKQEIPEDMFEVIAEIYAFIYKINKEI